MSVSVGRYYGMLRGQLLRYFVIFIRVGFVAAVIYLTFEGSFSFTMCASHPSVSHLCLFGRPIHQSMMQYASFSLCIVGRVCISNISLRVLQVTVSLVSFSISRFRN